MKYLKAPLVLVVALAFCAGAFAFEFDAKRWRRDVRNLGRIEKLSAKMRANFRDFASRHGNATTISGEQHALADHTIAPMPICLRRRGP